MSSHLDRMLEHYLTAAIQKADVTEQNECWQGRLNYASGELIAHAASEPEVRSGLKALVERRVFEAMRKGQALPVIAGIDITPGSC